MALDVNDEKVVAGIRNLITECGGDFTTFDGELVAQLIQTSLRLLMEGHDTGQLKLISRALKEMRYAYRIFNQYGGVRRVSIFGSARTPEDHPDYKIAKEFSQQMAAYGWMCMTGAANGIMKAGLEGAKKESGFGLSIKLPFESGANSFIEGDPKLISFKYFFTRKLMFMSHSDAVAAFPGGFGTMDELFEVLTLMQTGKASILPIVLMEGGKGYWQHWEDHLNKQILAKGWMSPEDKHFYHIAKNVEDAVEHIQDFYRTYHSSRYVKENLVMRLHHPLAPQQIDKLNDGYGILIKSGKIESCNPFPEENDHLELPRITFCHNRMHYGTVRALINQINSF